MDETPNIPVRDDTTTEQPVASVSPRARRKQRRRLLLIAGGIAALLIVATLGGVALFREEADPGGLVFVIPAGAAEKLERPTIDSAIVVPTDIRFGPGDEARITIRNEDSTANRAGPWVVTAGQTYTIGPLPPGTYQFDCTVDPAESVTVTVAG
jgi:hypothetical protein